jgi:uncharacterized protein (UPF0276 family)
MRQLTGTDRFGLGWRGALAGGILAHRDRIDLIEIVADDPLCRSRRGVRALRTLAEQIPVSLHGVSLGLASTLPVEPKRLDRMARLVAAIRPESWSEHLAFVRAGGIEIGHLMAPPRSAASVEGACRNLERAAQVIGARPAVENIATLIEPPLSTFDEAGWIGAIIEGSGAGLLLDLHNLYANAVNFGLDPLALLRRFPLDRVESVHLSGGRWIDGPNGSRRLLDDHVHDVPAVVFDLLVELGRLAPQPLTVIIERDGAYPPIAALLAQLDQARKSLAMGRRRAAA